MSQKINPQKKDEGDQKTWNLEGLKNARYTELRVFSKCSNK